jgi:hypothetical protein
MLTCPVMTVIRGALCVTSIETGTQRGEEKRGEEGKQAKSLLGSLRHR